MTTETGNKYENIPQENIVIGQDGIGDLPIVKGVTVFEKRIPSVDDLFQAYKTTGLQSTLLADAADEINKMLHWRLSHDPISPNETDPDRLDPEFRKNTKCFIWLAYTSNLVTSGLRETFLFLAKHKLIDCIVTTAGGIEEDFMKCLTPFAVNKWEVDDRSYRVRGWNRTANMVVPNANYCAFEEWFTPILDKCYEEQEKDKVIWTPSMLIRRMGEEINDENSIYYWCAKNDIPVFCPAITDGAIGDNLYFHSYKTGHLIMDVTGDIRKISNLACGIKGKSGVIVLGGGVPKHHVCNANLLRNGSDYAVYINTGVSWDGSDAGATPSEALSWGKIRLAANPVKVTCEVSLVFPMLVAQTFGKYYHEVVKKEEKE